MSKEILVSALKAIAGEGMLFPILRCQERSSGHLCAVPAEHVAFALDGHVVVCERCARFYADHRQIQRDDLDIVIGNLRDQARNALESLET